MRSSTRLFISYPVVESLFILFPPFLSVILAFVFYQYTDYREMTPVFWLFIVLFVDVAHVWTTIFRTYLNKSFLKQRSDLLLYVPVGCFIVGVLLYTAGKMVFWRILAYVALFHFIRQQYGIFMLYARKTEMSVWQQRIGKLCIYLSTIAPVVHWHFSLPKKFSWFMEGDFFVLPYNQIIPLIVWAITAISFLLYLYLELKAPVFNWPKHLVLFGTLLSWSIGIVVLNNDISFTLTNVLTHGIPYFALVWMSSCQGEDQIKKKTFGVMQVFSKSRLVGVLFMLALVVFFGFFEELFWDIFVWHEHQSIFSWIYDGVVHSDHAMLSLLVPLFSVPQVTHYVLDGFIWKGKQSFDGLRF
jgi:hypothetical protein